jgi:putative endonuclease
VKSTAVRSALSLSKPFSSTYEDRPWTTEEIGEIGELLSVLWLKRNKCKLLARNYQAPHGGEVDIVCREGDVLCFVEVKTRTKVDEIHRPRDAVNLEKQRLIQRGARSWIKMLHRSDVIWRYDIMEVFLLNGELPRLNLVVNAFQEPR